LIASAISAEADLLVGDRHGAGHVSAENKHALHGFGNRDMHDWVIKLSRSNSADIISGFRVPNWRFVKSHPKTPTASIYG
jgi:hypothetical protein